MKNINNEVIEMANEFRSGDPLITSIEWYGKRQLQYTNFGSKKVNKEGNPVMHGRWTTTEDVSVYTNKPIDEVLAAVSTLFTKEDLIEGNFKYCKSKINKKGKVSSWKSYADFNDVPNWKSPDRENKLFWLKENQAIKLCVYLKNGGNK